MGYHGITALTEYAEIHIMVINPEDTEDAVSLAVALAPTKASADV
jgi:hypothetical protein